MLEHWTEIICDKSTCANSKDGRCTLTNVKLENIQEVINEIKRGVE
jgi:hypothetical protein